MRSLPLTLCLLVAACPGEQEEDPSSEACEHATAGPFAPATAGSDTASAPNISAEHTAHQITLIEIDGGKGGFVRYDVAEAGVHRVFLSSDVPVSAQDAAGNALELVEPIDETACARIVKSHHVQLGIGSAFFSLGPTSESAVTMIVELDDHEGEHDE
jgi:hypothetical protein